MSAVNSASGHQNYWNSASGSENQARQSSSIAIAKVDADGSHFSENGVAKCILSNTGSTNVSIMAFDQSRAGGRGGWVHDGTASRINGQWIRDNRQQIQQPATQDPPYAQQPPIRSPSAERGRFDAMLAQQSARAESSAAVAMSETAQAGAGQQIPTSESLIQNLSLRHRTCLKNFVKYAGEESLHALLNSGQSAYGNTTVKAWLDLPREQNPYGVNRKASGNGGGGAAVTAFLKYHGKYH